MPEPSLASIHVGIPQSFGSADAVSPFDKPWTTGIFKHTIDGPVTVGSLGLDDDGQADTQAHGGVDKAICAYSADHYDHWRRTLGRGDFTYGAFGENFTLRHVTEDDVCIGDTWAIGAITVQISQPRQPCWKLARKWRIKAFADDVIASGLTGWYFRTLSGGQVTAGDRCALIARPHPEWTIAAANRVMHTKPHDRVASASLADVALLSAAWQRTLRARVHAPS